MKGYPKWFTKYFIAAVIFSLFATGVLLTPTTLELRFQWKTLWRLNEENRILIAAMHVIIGFLTCSLMGALWSIHMRHEWRRKKNRLSGIILVSAITLLMLSGVGIYYFGNEKLVLLTSGSHLFIGITIFGIYIWHSLLYRKE